MALLNLPEPESDDEGFDRKIGALLVADVATSIRNIESMLRAFGGFR